MLPAVSSQRMVGSGHLWQDDRCTPLESEVHHKVVNPLADCCGWTTEWICRTGPLELKQGSHRKLEPKIPQDAESKIQLVFTRASSGEDGLSCNRIQVATPRVHSGHKR